MIINDNVARQHGAIQMKTKDGSLNLFRLLINLKLRQTWPIQLVIIYGWIGAVYYHLIEKRLYEKIIIHCWL